MENGISVVVCSRENTDESKKIVKHVQETCDCVVHVYFMYNPEGVGLSEIYNGMLEKVENDIVVFMHDDITLLRKGWGKELLNIFNNNKDYGIVGVAGTKQFNENAMWWTTEKKYGQVLHRHEGKSWLTVYSPLLEKDVEEVCVVDGLFIAVHRKRITKKFDENTKFDMYDICLCLDNYLDGKTKIGVTTKIRIAHNSIGQMREGWYAAREYILKKYEDDLPIDIDKIKSK